MNDRGKRGIAGNSIGAMMLSVGLLIPLSGCNQPAVPPAQDTAVGTEPATTGTAVGAAGAWEGATVSEVVGNAAAYAGKTVVVSGDVNRIFGSRSFTLGGEGWLGGEELLVVTTEPIPAVLNRPADTPLTDRDIVQVVGTVRTVTIVEIERELTIDLDPAIETEFNTRPVLIAREVDVTPATGVTTVTTPGVTTGATPTTVAPPTTVPPATTPP
ncbi:MAG: hypothetical protein KY468_08865 [Armatimonadetes bacterium]|nr:hypothetical protein [Armatimonadota bacterium]